MKVIKEGKKIKDTMRVKCKTCEAELEIQAGDLEMLSDCRPFESTTYSYKCPCYKRTNYIKYTELEEGIRFDLKNNLRVTTLKEIGSWYKTKKRAKCSLFC